MYFLAFKLLLIIINLVFSIIMICSLPSIETAAISTCLFCCIPTKPYLSYDERSCNPLYYNLAIAAAADAAYYSTHY